MEGLSRVSDEGALTSLQSGTSAADALNLVPIDTSDLDCDSVLMTSE